MTNIKIDERYKEPWEVLKAHLTEGKRVAYRLTEEYRPGEYRELFYEAKKPLWRFSERDYFIIDDSKPENIFEDEKWDWEFFSQYGGLWVKVIGGSAEYKVIDTQGLADCELRPSPFYPWFGGECPVPDNVEVEIIVRDDINYVGTAPEFAKDWKRGRVKSHVDIIAFKLTGRVL